MNIKKKIVNNILIITIILMIIGISFFIGQTNKLGKNLLFSLQKDRLTSIRYFKAVEVEAYFNNLIENLSIIATSREVINSLQEFSKTFPQYLTEVVKLDSGYKTEIINGYLNDFVATFKNYNNGNIIDAKNLVNLLSENSFALQYNYIFNNPYSFSHKEQLVTLQDGTNYSLAHSKYHSSMLAHKQQFGFYDIFLVDGATGNIVYTVNKELDFTTSLINGPYANSNLAEIYKNIMSSNQINYIAVADFAPYRAFYDNPAAFIGIAVYNETGNKIGAIIIQISIDKLNDIMSNKEEWKKIGLGDTVNTSIVGADFKLRTNNRFFLENQSNFLQELENSKIDQTTLNLIKAKKSLIGILKTDTLAVRQAFSGIEGFAEYIDYRKIPVISSFSPLKIPGLNWAIIVKMNKAEALHTISSLRHKVIYTGCFTTIILVIIAIMWGKFTAKGIVASIYNITDQINKIAQTHDLTKRLAVTEKSEFSIMINAFNEFIANLQASLKNIVQISEDNYMQILDDDSSSDLSNSLKPSQDSESIKNQQFNDILYEKIHNLAKEFKLIENEKERTKYW